MKNKKRTKLALIVSTMLMIAAALAACTPGADDINSQQAPVETLVAPTGPSRTFNLENPTDQQRLERLLSVTLNEDGTAILATPPISNYAMPKCTYTVEDGELLILAAIDDTADEEFYGVKNGDIIARFNVVDNNTLMFESSTVLLYADNGAQYIDRLF